jgi:trimeric autotransporter adhesin
MRVQRAALSTVALTLIACGGSGSTAPPKQSGPTLSITIANEPVASGTTAQASATITDASGHPSAASNVTWSSSDGGVALIDASGMITGRLAGSTTIQATAAGITAHHTVAVVAGAAARVSIASGDLQVANRGANVADPLCVLVTDAAGNFVAGAIASYTVATGGGTMGDPTTPSSGPNGIAVSGFWRLGSLAGQQTVTAFVNGAGSVTFKATAN